MKINICKAKACSEKFSHYMFTRLKNDKERFNLKNMIIEEVECMWECKKSPNVKIDWKINHYMNPAKLSKMVLNNNKKKKK